MSLPECTTQPPQEIWKDIPEWEGYYIVSTLGRIKRIKVGAGKSARFLTPCKDSRGYAHIALSRPSMRNFQTHVHRVVALAFLGPPNGRFVNHRNGDKMDNRDLNLEYVTPMENTGHALRHGLIRTRRQVFPLPYLPPNPQVGCVPRVLAVAGSKWRPVVGFEWYYEISDIGQLRRIDNGRLLSPSLSKGYPVTSLSKKGKYTRVSIHRLVAAAFLGPANGMQVNHINNDRADARLSNLEYVTPRQNQIHAYATGSKRYRGRGLTPRSVLEIDRRVQIGDDPARIARDMETSINAIRLIENRKTWAFILPPLSPEQRQASAERSTKRRRRPKTFQGEANYHVRYSDALVLEIDKLLQGGVLGLDIAAVMGVKNHFVSAIKRRETRKYLFPNV